jgi:chaperonin GroES
MGADVRWRLLVTTPCIPLKEMHMKLRPLHDRVIVKRLEQETKTASGIFIPDNAAEKPDQGEVLAVGPGRKTDKGELIALNVKVGDRVLFGKYSGQTVKVDGDELLVMKEDDLFAVVEGAPAAGLKKVA